MTDSIKRRGPDDVGFYFDNNAGLGFRRLSIVDVEGGHQPLSNEQGTIWLVFNGEIYGYKDLMAQLQGMGHAFKTRSDSEVLVHAYEQWGDACFDKINGMFAVAIWDAARRRLILARDRLGKKPLYWTVCGDTLFFGSELKALLASGRAKREIDPKALALYLRTDSVPTPWTIFRDSYKLEPAQALAWSNGKIEKVWSFWKCPCLSSSEVRQTEVLAHARELIDTAVRERLVADVQVGVCLSGGLDSAVIAESATRQAGTRLQAFTIGFEDRSYDESKHASLVAKALGMDHHVEILNINQALDMIGQAQDLLDEPLADNAILPQLLLSRFMSSRVKSVLSGDGGDELLLGYQHIPAHGVLQKAQAMPVPVLDLFGRILKNIRSSDAYFGFGFKAQRLARGINEKNPWARDVKWRGAFDDIGQILTPNILEQSESGLAESLLEARAQEVGCFGQEEFWKHWTWSYLRTFLMDDVLVKVDRSSMWFGLEVRSPLLDTRVVSYLINLSEKYKLGAWKNKRLFVELLKGRVPEAVLAKKKHGISVPISAWLKGELRDALLDLCSPGHLTRQGLFDARGVTKLISEHMAGKRDRRKELWALFMFQLWYDRWFA